MYSKQSTQNSFEAMASRQQFYVELQEGETTIVSWKKLVLSAKRELELKMPANTLEAQTALAPTAIVKDPIHQAPNRLTVVIERIERLFQGEDSDDDNENADDGPTEDQYDTDDSFIDDEELDNYFMREKIKTKHSGFFINRGALEKISDEPSAIEVVQPLRKKRAYLKKNKAIMPLSLEGVVPKQRKRKEPGMRKKREPNGSKKNIVQEQDQGPCQNLKTEVVESKKRKFKEPGMRKKREPNGSKKNIAQEQKKTKKNPVQEQDLEELRLNFEIENKN